MTHPDKPDRKRRFLHNQEVALWIAGFALVTSIAGAAYSEVSTYLLSNDMKALDARSQLQSAEIESLIAAEQARDAAYQADKLTGYLNSKETTGAKQTPLLDGAIYIKQDAKHTMVVNSPFLLANYTQFTHANLDGLWFGVQEPTPGKATIRPVKYDPAVMTFMPFDEKEKNWDQSFLVDTTEVSGAGVTEIFFVDRNGALITESEGKPAAGPGLMLSTDRVEQLLPTVSI